MHDKIYEKYKENYSQLLRNVNYNVRNDTLYGINARLHATGEKKRKISK